MPSLGFYLNNDPPYAFELKYAAGNVSCTCPRYEKRGTCQHLSLAVDSDGKLRKVKPKLSKDSSGAVLRNKPSTPAEMREFMMQYCTIGVV